LSPAPLSPAPLPAPGGQSGLFPANPTAPSPAARPAVAALLAPSPRGLAPPALAPLAPESAGPIVTATEAQILADQPASIGVFRFQDNPAIVVLDFASLIDQGEMFNRMAVFEEKDGFPHDRVLPDGDLDRAIRGGGDDPATFYYGHDYRAADLARFFSLADRDHVALTPQEEWLRRLIGRLGWDGPDATGAMITLPRLGADGTVDAKSRGTILRHELSHGEYFTNPAFAAFVQRFWRETMTEADRAAFRHFLVADHYDGGIEDLMVNETQAYLVHTPDARFFSAAFVGLAPARIAALRAAFIQGMPKGWLHDDDFAAAATLTRAGAAAQAP
jgi:hypothetical protein